jgi:hypothetical protein
MVMEVAREALMTLDMAPAPVPALVDTDLGFVPVLTLAAREATATRSKRTT